MKSKWIKIFLVFTAILLVLITWLLSSHAHSKNAVDRYKDQLRAAGEKLTIEELLPPRVDPEQNGARLFFEACKYLIYGGTIDSNPPPAMRMVAPGKAMIAWRQPEIISWYVPGAPTNRLSVCITNSWQELREELEHDKQALELLRQASERPQFDFELDYHSFGHFNLNYLAKIKQGALVLSPAAISDLNGGDPASAVTNLHTELALVDAWNEPVIISQLVRIAITAIASGPQWEVLHATNLTDSELRLLQHDWESMEFIKPMENAMEIDRLWEIANIQNSRTSNNPSASFWIASSSGSGTGSSGGFLDELKQVGQAAKRKTSDALWRVSWSYSDELHVLQGDQVTIECLRQVETNGYFEDALAEQSRKMSALGFNGTNADWLRNQLDDEIWGSLVGGVGSLGKSTERILSIEASRRIMIAAIALRRYQLRHGSWPPDLKTLVPDFLSEVPRDPVDGRPLRYRRNADGTFLLYSIGSDGKDDGGDPTFTGSSLYWLRARDWVWPQPATAEEIQNYYKNQPK